MMDYSSSGLDIQAAMVDLVRKHPDNNNRPTFINWGSQHVQTSDSLILPRRGRVLAVFRSCSSEVEQGFDLKLTHGFLILGSGEKVSHLRTWHEPHLDPEVDYEFEASKGVLQFWNVYRRTWPDGRITEERMTGNAGFWVEQVAENHRVYHCSHGATSLPDFESLVVELKLLPPL